MGGGGGVGFTNLFQLSFRQLHNHIVLFSVMNTYCK